MKLQNIHPLSEFQRNAKAHIARLKRSGEPSILTVNGQAEVVVLSAEAYQKMLDENEMLDNLNAIHKGLLEAERGEGMPVKEAFAMIRAKAKARRRKSA
jgi:PHD/YefM family antitoxin component YafN of YafNO toxin-antitoxin module